MIEAERTATVDRAQNTEFVPPKSHDMSQYPSGLGELLLAVAFLVLGFLFWEWGLLSNAGGGIGGFLFFTLGAAVSFAYLRWQGVRQTPTSWLALAIVLLGALPFLLYDQRDISILNVGFEICACLVWLAISCKTTISARLDGFLAGDLFCQAIIVPFANFATLFSSLRRGAGSTSASSQEHAPQASVSTRPQHLKSLLILLAGVAVSLPLIVFVVLMLTMADDGFAGFISSLGAGIDLERPFTYLFKFAFGIPVACYIFGAVFGNARRRHANTISLEQANTVLSAAHRLPRLALYGPLLLLAVVYAAFFISMGAYLFSAFGGELPASYTYAQYARQGFFELTAVAAINLMLLAFAYLFGQRAAGEYPGFLRMLTGVISLFTCLLVLTAASKMLLYIGSYGLTRLRVYTTWFMLFLLLVFVVLLIWHLRPFNAGKPLVIITVVCALCLFLVNTDGLIARYNVQRYLDGQAQTIDVPALAYLSDAALPALHDLRDQTPDTQVREQAEQAIAYHRESVRGMLEDPAEQSAYYNWNLQTFLAD
ncbi:MAG: DUF4173 domain-containing protein [Coriobacteriales bacterium]|jgi:hypothetical protein|nr:DUF4173 domain-containing protein [Coriobacteriales bacterium]